MEKNGIVKLFEEAEKEPQVSPAQILAEIEPLLNDYFVANCEVVENQLIMHLLNGQNITLTAN